MFEPSRHAAPRPPGHPAVILTDDGRTFRPLTHSKYLRRTLAASADFRHRHSGMGVRIRPGLELSRHDAPRPSAEPALFLTCRRPYRVRRGNAYTMRSSIVSGRSEPMFGPVD